MCVWTGSEMLPQPQHIWHKWWDRYRALLIPDNGLFIWIRCVWAGERLKHAGKRASRTRIEKHFSRVYEPVKRLMWKWTAVCCVCSHVVLVWHLGWTFHKILYKSMSLFGSFVICCCSDTLVSQWESNPLAVKTVQETTERKLQFYGVPVLHPLHVTEKHREGRLFNLAFVKAHSHTARNLAEVAIWLRV